MRRGILARRSAAADVCRFTGALAVPILVFGAAGARFGFVPPDAVVPVFTLAFALAFAAIVVGIYALTDIWTSGAGGAVTTFAGLFYALPAVLVLAGLAAAALVYPKLSDVSTDPDDRPPLAVASPDISADAIATQAESYPDLAPAVFPQPIATVYAAAGKLVATRGWTVVSDLAPASVLPEPEAQPAAAIPDDKPDEALDAKATVTQSRAEAAVPPPPAAMQFPDPPPVPESALIQAVAPSPVFAEAEDVTVRLRETPEGTRVDLRSASRSGAHDLGENARRVRRFVADLTAALQRSPGSAASSAAVASSNDAADASLPAGVSR